MIRSVIVDDEPMSRSALAETIKGVSAEVAIAGEANSVADAVKTIDTVQPDLVFLDIELGDGSGFDVIENTVYKEYKVIFTTAYNNYATDAFRVNAVDYLLKPVKKEFLSEAVNRVLSISTEEVNNNLHKVMQHMVGGGGRVSIHTTEGQTLINIKDLVRCESDNNYCKIFFAENEQLYVAKTLKDLEEQLQPYGFERVHQSHLINVNHLKRYMSKDGGSLLMSDGSKIPVAQRKRAHLLSILDNYKL